MIHCLLDASDKRASIAAKVEKGSLTVSLVLMDALKNMKLGVLQTGPGGFIGRINHAKLLDLFLPLLNLLPVNPAS